MTPDTFAAGYRFIGPMFSGVGTQTAETAGSYSVTDLLPAGTSIPDGSDLTAAITVQKLAPDGTTDGNILYWRDCKVGRTTYKGWYTAAGTTTASMTIEAGEGLCCKIPEGASCSLTFSGEVPSGDVYLTLNNNGHTCGCNPQPADVNVQTVLPYALEGYTVPDGSDLNSAISLQKIAPDGTTDGNILYWRNCKVGRTTYNGWYTAAGTTAAELTLGPGEGLWIDSPNASGVMLLFPSAL